MAKFVIEGGRPLKGEIEVKGSKNSAFPILAAALLAKGPCLIEQVPRIKDVENFLKILEGLGVKVRRGGSDLSEVYLDTSYVDPNNLDKERVRKLRGSVLIMGALLSRFGKVRFPHPGGDKIGARPLDTHLRAFQDLGATIKQARWGAQAQGSESEYEIEMPQDWFARRGKIGEDYREVILDEFSVTGTENALLVACNLPGTTVLKLAAAEPHIQDLCRFLQLLGIKIEGIGTHTLVVRGRVPGDGNPAAGSRKRRAKAGQGEPGVADKKLRVRFRLTPDYLEAGTFAVLAAASRSHIKITNAPLGHLDAVLRRLEAMGVNYALKIRDLAQESYSRLGDLIVKPGSVLRSTRVQAMPYPGFPTDLQAPFGVLATQAQGISLIHDPLYEGRLKYIDELKKMGANAIIADPHRALISGPTPLYGTKLESLDIRAGATMVIAGLVAEGKTTIEGAEMIDRGYERLEERLQALGANIKRV